MTLQHVDLWINLSISAHLLCILPLHMPILPPKYDGTSGDKQEHYSQWNHYACSYRRDICMVGGNCNYNSTCSVGHGSYAYYQAGRQCYQTVCMIVDRGTGM